ncbi:MAG: MBOAT family O-acyltransferase [Alloprevotella sp.]|nr:MBOAT family O-acyltransferase [Alloprevotella sp.]
MLFNSLEFLIFLPIVFLLYWHVFKPLRWQNFFVVVASYVFYGWWDWRFLLLILFTSLCSFASGILLQRFDESKKWRKVISGTNIAINIAILGVVKYYDFFASQLVEAFSGLGVQLNLTSLNIILPVGISFYTFQALSYTVDIYRRKLEPTRDVIAFLAFISFFPQLVAGPIERATNLLPQFLKPRKFDYALAVDGMRQILWGLFKKMVVADTCATACNEIFADYATKSGGELIVGALFFTFQIYGDFSGYSDIAIGTAKLFGVRLMRNFNVPYFSRDIAEFWRRWHISLNTWCVDYVYIPLGGSRNGKWKTVRNTLIIFGHSGLRHGANWTYIAWGFYHAFLFIPLFLFGLNHKRKDVVAAQSWHPSWKEALQMLTTFCFVVIGWIIFRAENIGQAWGYISRMFCEFNGTFPKHGNTPLIYCGIVLLVEWMQRKKEHAFQIPHRSLFAYRPVRWIFYFAVFVCTYFFMGNQSTFIYFQF